MTANVSANVWLGVHKVLMMNAIKYYADAKPDLYLTFTNSHVGLFKRTR